MLFLARDSMFTTAVIGFEKAQFLMLGVICLLGAAFLIVNRRKLPQILKDRRMIVAGIAAAVLLLPMLVKRDWQLMYFSVARQCYCPISRYVPCCALTGLAAG